jgi:DNA modification methylase
MDGSELIGNNPGFQKYKGKLDFVFTSPPYFNREQYSTDETQSFKAYSEYEDWRKNFLFPTLKTAYEYLKNDRYILWNIASIKIGKDTYFDLEGDSRKILEHLGCEYKGKYKMLMTRMIGLDPSKSGILNSVKHQNKAYKFEPIFVFYKG